MKRFVVIVASALTLGCAQSGGATYGDVCHTVRELCVAADALCLFAPRAKAARLDSAAHAQHLALIVHQIDSLAAALETQLHQEEEYP